jgi:hypothetical protein
VYFLKKYLAPLQVSNMQFVTNPASNKNSVGSDLCVCGQFIESCGNLYRDSSDPHCRATDPTTLLQPVAN